jgi:hypothetical protein
VSTFFGSRGDFRAIYETPKNAIKKKSNTTEGEGEKNVGKKSRIFCDEPRRTFPEKNRVFELPLLRNAQKTP